MATLRYASITASRFNPISAALANLQNEAGTMVVLVRMDAGDAGNDVIALLDNYPAASWYHGLGADVSTDQPYDDDGFVTVNCSISIPIGATANDFFIFVVDWPAGGAALERFHVSSKMGVAESWTHTDSNAVNGGNRAGPGTTGDFVIGDGGSIGALDGDVALVAVWAGTRFTDANVLDLWVNKKTSDWWNHPAGQPTLLLECTATTLVDIGANPSTFADNGAARTGLVPTGWTFYGRGEAQIVPNLKSQPVQTAMRW